jgi:hypothetical protein
MAKKVWVGAPATASATACKLIVLVCRTTYERVVPIELVHAADEFPADGVGLR